MRPANGVFCGGCGRLLSMAVVAGSLWATAGAQTAEVAITLRQSPAHGGILRPDPGVHYFAAQSQVMLTAIPNPGYEFLCWLGMVSDPTANRTIVYLDEPKIIIALFDRIESHTLSRGDAATASSGGAPFTRGGLISTAGYDGARSPSVQGARAGRAGVRYEAFVPQIPVQPEPATPVEPEPPIPEPATGVLLVLGSWFAFARRGSNKQSRQEIVD